MTKILGHCLAQVKGQVTRDHQRSNFANFNISRQIGAKLATSRATAPHKSEVDSSFNTFSEVSCNILPKINGLALTVKNKWFRIAVFTKKRILVITFDSRKARHSFCQYRVSFVETSRHNYKLALQNHLENLTYG